MSLAVCVRVHTAKCVARSWFPFGSAAAQYWNWIERWFQRIAMGTRIHRQLTPCTYYLNRRVSISESFRRSGTHISWWTATLRKIRSVIREPVLRLIKVNLRQLTPNVSERVSNLAKSILDALMQYISKNETLSPEYSTIFNTFESHFSVCTVCGA